MEYSKVKHSMFGLMKNNKKWFDNQTEPKWKNVIFIVSFHVCGVYWSYLYAFPAKWQTLMFTCFMYVVSGSGITCGVHRMWTHRSYKAKLPLRIYLMLSYASTGQNTIYDWVRDHRLHHKYSDTEADPHNSNRGFFFSHIGWLMTKKNKFVLEKGRQIDMSDILEDPVAMFERKYAYRLRILLCFILPTITGILFWGEKWKCAVAWQCFIRVLAVFHSEMTVNSLAHMFGYKPYNKNIKPTENLFVSIVTGGEGWHNYHHTFPWDYKAAETFDIPNISKFCILFWAKMGLAYDLKETSPELLQAVLNNQNRKNSRQKQSSYVHSFKIKGHG